MHQLRHWGRELLSYVTDTLSVRHRKAVRDERAKLDEIAAVLFEGYPPPEEHLVVAASLHRTFPTVPPERLKEAADVVVEAMAIPDGEARLAGLDQAGIKVADIFTAK